MTTGEVRARRSRRISQAVGLGLGGLTLAGFLTHLPSSPADGSSEAARIAEARAIAGHTFDKIRIASVQNLADGKLRIDLTMKKNLDVAAYEAANMKTMIPNKWLTGKKALAS